MMFFMLIAAVDRILSQFGGSARFLGKFGKSIEGSGGRIVRRGFPGRPALSRVTPGAYLARFTAYNAAFLAVLLFVCAPFV